MNRNKIVVYTALFGEIGTLITPPKSKHTDYICYTNRTDLKSKTWKIIVVDQPVLGDNQRSNRYYKILPHKHLPSTYEISIYVDANTLILKDPYKLANESLKESKMAYFDHMNTKKDPRDCIYQEYEAILEMAEKHHVFKDDPEIMKKQIQRFKAEGYPKNNGLLSGAVLIRKHFEEEISDMMESWWEIIANESRRDQLSFNYVAWKHNFQRYTLLEGDIRKGNPWFSIITHRDNYKSAIFKEKLRNLFKR